MSTTPDIHIPDSIVISADTFSLVFIRRLLTKLSGIITIDPEQDPTAWAEEWQMLEELFWALKPTNPVEAVLAAHFVNTQHSGMELIARAAQPGLSDETVRRPRTGAHAAGRAAPHHPAPPGKAPAARRRRRTEPNPGAALQPRPARRRPDTTAQRLSQPRRRRARAQVRVGRP